MNFAQSSLLRLTRLITQHTRIKGRYLLAETVVNVLKLRNSMVESRVGRYRADLNMSDMIQRQVSFGLYERDEANFVLSLLKPGDVFFDLGANVGFYSLLAAERVGAAGAVHAFEPMPDNAATLRRTIERNSISHLHLNEVAVAESPGFRTLYYPDASWGNSGWATLVTSERKHHSIVVPVITLDQYVRQHQIEHVRLIKLDIEGAELLALQGATDLLARPDAPDLFLEINPHYLVSQGIDSRAVTQFVAAQGYTVSVFGKRTPLDPAQLITTMVNVYCVKQKT